MRGRDFWLAVQQAGASALPIIGVISFLVGMIQAFVGGSQLALFGAQIFVANLVAIAMLREMGPLMAALIMAGRTGSAYAAELGTMQVNEEIDALRGMGISPVEFLVLPRLLALALMMPLLAVYANLFGVLGGAVVGVGVLGISPDHLLRAEPPVPAPAGPGGRPRQGRRVRRPGRGRRLPARHPLGAQRRLRRRLDHLGRGQRDRGGDRRRLRDQRGVLCARHLTSPRRRRSRPPHIEVEDLTMAFGSRTLMERLTFTIRRGDVFVIMGGSGSGKSTLMRHLVGLHRPAQGTDPAGRHQLLGRGAAASSRRCSAASASCTSRAPCGPR